MKIFDVETILESNILLFFVLLCICMMHLILKLFAFLPV